MFYVREKLSEGVEINIEINDDNVFTKCTDCGEEMNEDIDSLYKECSDFSIMESSMICAECTKKRIDGKKY